ncbi:cyclase family protein [Aeromicrobium alkaliterrae]
MNDAIPSYQELRHRVDGPAGSSWGVFGPDDELGTLNHLTPQTLLAAMGTVVSGEVVNLDLPLDAFDPALVSTRKPLSHHLFASNPHHRDEYLDNFFTQNATQIDGFRHIGHPDLGFYNGANPEHFTAGSPFLGINRLAEHGIAGRGVVLDVDRYLRSLGHEIDHRGEAIPAQTLAATAAHQGVELRPGDILLVRTGWLTHYRHDPVAAVPGGEPMRSSGLEASHETVAWLWDHQFALVATDNFAVESWPAHEASPFITRSEASGDVASTSHTGLMHRVLIPLLGMVLGELWDLDELAARCARDGRWDCLIVASPLNLTGGAGSPANATAIR